MHTSLCTHTHAKCSRLSSCLRLLIVRVSVCVNLCMSVRMHVCLYACMYVYVCVHALGYRISFCQSHVRASVAITTTASTTIRNRRCTPRRLRRFALSLSFFVHLCAYADGYTNTHARTQTSTNKHKNTNTHSHILASAHTHTHTHIYKTLHPCCMNHCTLDANTATHTATFTEKSRESLLTWHILQGTWEGKNEKNWNQLQTRLHISRGSRCVCVFCMCVLCICARGLRK